MIPEPPPRTCLRERALSLVASALTGAAVGLLCGSASALFLVLLDHATALREAHEELVYALPFAGLVIGVLYQRFGKPVQGGNALVIERLHDDGPQLPTRMAPMVVLGTVLTHLFGGSAGREGTAVQMGASLADALAHRMRGRRTPRRHLLLAGVAGGFGSVFGTPVAGALFALELAVVGRVEYQALLPVLVAALVGDLTTRAWGVGHTHYPAPAPLDLTMWVLLKWVAFAAAVALTTVAFVALTQWLKRQAERHVTALGMRMLIGGALVVVLWKVVGTGDYLGLGVPMIVRSFEDPQLPPYAFAAKLLFTAVTLGAGFLGGEVTPLFFVGAALGNLLSHWLGLPLALCAGVGLASVFASASNAPLALSVMAVELLGASVLPHAAVVCVLSFLMSGHRGIYPAQRLGHEKGGTRLEPPPRLQDRPPP